MIADLFFAPRQRAATGISSAGIVYQGSGSAPTAEAAMKLSAVYAAVDIRSNSMAVLPAYIMDTTDRTHKTHPILELLSVRPNEAMTPSVRKKMLEESVLLTGNAYDWIIRDPISRAPVELIPINGNLVQVWVDSNLRPWYDVAHPVTGEIMRLPSEDICHYKGPSRNGIKGESVLACARDTIRSGLAASEYNTRFYESGGTPSGVLQVDTDLGGMSEQTDSAGNKLSKKEVLRREWEKVHSGPSNAHRIAILDLGLKYQPLSISQADSQFVEQQEITVLDIARFFGVPAYKLQAGKQSYNANEQAAIEYMMGLQPRVTQTEEEQTWKLLPGTVRKKGWEVRYNMMAILRSDSKSRSSYYKAMWECGAYSVNDIRALEDMPDTDGGNEHNASLNYVPLSEWRRLSLLRNGGGETK